MKFQPVLDSQSAFLANPQEKAAYLETVLSTHLKMGDGTNFGQALEWGVKNFVENGQADVFSNAFAKVAQQTGKTGTSGKAPDPKKLKEAYGKAIYATETARSIPAFQALSKAAASFSGANATNNTVKASIPQGWKLVPADGWSGAPPRASGTAPGTISTCCVPAAEPSIRIRKPIRTSL